MSIAKRTSIGAISALVAAFLTPTPANALFEPAELPTSVVIVPQGEFNGVGYSGIQIGGFFHNSLVIDDAVTHPVRELQTEGSYFSSVHLSDAFDLWGDIVLQEPNGGQAAPLAVIPETCENSVPATPMFWAGTPMASTSFTFSCEADTVTLSGQDFNPIISLTMEGSYATWNVDVGQVDTSGGLVDLEAWVLGNVGSDGDTFVVNQGVNWAVTSGDLHDPILGFKASEPIDFALISEQTHQTVPPGEAWLNSQEFADSTVIHLQNLVSDSVEGPDFSVSTMLMDYMVSFYEDAQTYAVNAIQVETTSACWNTVNSNDFNLQDQCGLEISRPYGDTQLLSDPGFPSGDLVTPAPSVAYNPFTGKWLSAWVEDTPDGLQLVGSSGTEVTDLNNDMTVDGLTSPGEPTLPEMFGEPVTVVAAGELGWVVFWVNPTFTEVWGLRVFPDLSTGTVTKFSDDGAAQPGGYVDVGALSAVPNSDFSKIFLTWRASNTGSDVSSTNQTVGTLLDISSSVEANGTDLPYTNFDPGVGTSQDLSYSSVDDVWASVAVMDDNQGLALSYVGQDGVLEYYSEIYPGSFAFDGIPFMIQGASIEYNSSSNLFSLVATIVDINEEGHLMTLWLDSSGDFAWPAPIFLDLHRTFPGEPESATLGLNGNLVVWSAASGACSDNQPQWCEKDTIYGLIMSPEPTFKMFGVGDYYGQHRDPEVSTNTDTGQVMMTWRGSEFDFNNDQPGMDFNYVNVLCADGCNTTPTGNQQAMVVSPTTVWVPANSVIPTQGSTVNFAFDANIVGSDYGYLTETYTQATVYSVAADYPLYCYENPDCIGSEGDIGFGIVFESDQNFQEFNGPYNIAIEVTQESTSYDSVFVEHAYGMQDGENLGLWFPNGRDFTSASSVLNAWMLSENPVLSVETNVDLVCPPWQSEGDCVDHEGTSGSFLALLSSPDQNTADVFTGVDSLGSLRDGYALVRGITATMDTNYNSGGNWCRPRHAKIQNEVFLGGSFIELGISESGSFGTTNPGPDFMRGAGWTRPGPIGMAADLDGYCQGSDLPIDFFVPGTPEERWSLGFIENDEDEPRYISYAPIMSDYFNDGELPFHRSDDRLTIESAVEDISTQTRLMARSTNIIYDDGEPLFEVIVTHSLSPENPFYRTEYLVNNISQRNFFNVRIMRNVDPDNSVFQSDSEDSYSTVNVILDQVTDGGTAQVQATVLPNDSFVSTMSDLGITTSAPLVFYSNDQRAVASFGGFTEPNPYEISLTEFFFDQDPEYDGAPIDPILNMQPTGLYTSCDCAIQMSADLGSVSAETQLAPFSMYTSLDSRDFSEVVDEVVIDQNEPDLLFPIQEFTSGNLFTSVANAISQDFSLQNLKINDMTQAEFNSLDPSEKSFSAAFGRFSMAQRYVGLDQGFVLNPGYKVSSFGHSSLGNEDEQYFNPDSDAQAYLYSHGYVSNFPDQDYPDSPVGALAKAVDSDSNIPVGDNNDKALYGATSVSFSLSPQARYFKLDFVLAMTETGEFNSESEQWEGYISEFADGVGIFVKGEDDDWLSAENCAAIPTTNSYLSMQSAGVLPPGSPTLTRQIATDNYLSLVAKTAIEGYQLNQNSFVDRSLTEDEGNMIAPPGIAISNRSLGSVVKFVTIPMTCVIDLQESGLDAANIEVGMAVANVYDAVLPPALFISTGSIRFADDQIAAPIAIEAQVQDRAEELYQVSTAPATAFDGPIVSDAIQVKTSVGATLQLSGKKLDSVTGIDVAGQSCKVISSSLSKLTCDLPKALSVGTYSISLSGSFGRLTATDVLVVIESQIQLAETRIKVTETGVRVYVLNPVGLGKIQFLVDGKEKFWVRAKNSKNKKLFKGYVVRNLKLKPGQTLKILVNGEVVDTHTQP